LFHSVTIQDSGKRPLQTPGKKTESSHTHNSIPSVGERLKSPPAASLINTERKTIRLNSASKKSSETIKSSESLVSPPKKIKLSEEAKLVRYFLANKLAETI